MSITGVLEEERLQPGKKKKKKETHNIQQRHIQERSGSADISVMCLNVHKKLAMHQLSIKV